MRTALGTILKTKALAKKGSTIKSLSDSIAYQKIM